MWERLMFQSNEILIYFDLFEKEHQVRYVETSLESGNHLVMITENDLERGIWLRPPQVKGTGLIQEQIVIPERVKTSWTMGDPIPEHLIKKKKRK
jgi:hypothetical protein